MRSSSEMFVLFEQIAQSDERIRVMTLEGSRVNPTITPDIYQDYDITFLVTEMESFLVSDEWLSVFGERAMLQKPEGMSLFPPSLGPGWFSYLMLFKDGVKIDLSLVPLKDKENYFASDPLIQVLLDKDGLCENMHPPSDKPFWIQCPSAEFYDDCANEFWLVSTYIVKGLLRGELLFANWHMEQILRKELLRMLSWHVGATRGYPVNVGKHHRDIVFYLSNDQNKLLMATYCLCSVDSAWDGLYAALTLFSEASQSVAQTLGFNYPDYEEEVRSYITVLQALI